MTDPGSRFLISFEGRRRAGHRRGVTVSSQAYDADTNDTEITIKTRLRLRRVNETTRK
jgi:hypothetical protein